jgi:hypothetical protein
MKKAIFIILLAINITPAHANEGGWVKVDASGNQIGQVIVCTPSVCGDGTSTFAKMTLKEGESYVLQSNADNKGNVAGMNTTPEITLKVEVATNQWTVTKVNTVIPTVSTSENDPNPEPITTAKIKTTVVETFNPVTDQPLTVVSKKAVIETPVVPNEEINLVDWWSGLVLDYAALTEWFVKFYEGWLMP